MQSTRRLKWLQKGAAERWWGLPQLSALVTFTPAEMEDLVGAGDALQDLQQLSDA